MAIDYKYLRNTLDTYSSNYFTQQLFPEINTYLTQAVSGPSGVRGMVKVLNDTLGFDRLRYSPTQNAKMLSDFVTDAAKGLSLISQYVATNTNVNKITDNLVGYFTKMRDDSYNSVTKNYDKGIFTATDVTNYLKSILPGNSYTYQKAANQSTYNVNTSGLDAIYMMQGQDAYRSELSKRLATTFNQAKLSSNLTGAIFSGDARFDQNASGEMLKNIGDTLFQLSKKTGTDQAALKLSQIFLDASKTGIFSADITKYFNPNGSDLAGSTLYLQNSLDTLDKTATTLTKELQATQAAEAERAAQEAAAQAQAQAEAEARAQAEAQAKAEAQAAADAQAAALKLAQETAAKKAQLVKQRTGGGTEGVSLFRQLATLGPGAGAPEADVQGKKNNLGSAETYGK